MQIDIQNVAKLARLRIEDDKLPKFQKEMESILKMVENLPDITDSDISVDPENPMELRKDIVTPSLKRDEVLNNAPQSTAGCIVVPKTIE